MFIYSNHALRLINLIMLIFSIPEISQPKLRNTRSDGSIKFKCDDSNTTHSSSNMALETVAMVDLNAQNDQLPR